MHFLLLNFLFLIGKESFATIKVLRIIPHTYSNKHCSHIMSYAVPTYSNKHCSDRDNYNNMYIFSENNVIDSIYNKLKQKCRVEEKIRGDDIDNFVRTDEHVFIVFLPGSEYVSRLYTKRVSKLTNILNPYLDAFDCFSLERMLLQGRKIRKERMLLQKGKIRKCGIYTSSVNDKNIKFYIKDNVYDEHIEDYLFVSHALKEISIYFTGTHEVCVKFTSDNSNMQVSALYKTHLKDYVEMKPQYYSNLTKSSILQQYEEVDKKCNKEEDKEYKKYKEYNSHVLDVKKNTDYLYENIELQKKFDELAKNNRCKYAIMESRYQEIKNSYNIVYILRGIALVIVPLFIFFFIKKLAIAFQYCMKKLLNSSLFLYIKSFK